MKCKNKEQSFVNLNIRRRPSVNVMQLCFGFYLRAGALFLQQWPSGACMCLHFPPPSYSVYSACSDQLALAKRTAKNDGASNQHCNDFHMCSPSLFLLPPSPLALPLPPTRMSPPFLLPRFTHFVLAHPLSPF